MNKTPVTRYNNIAISLHWLMAFLIVGMLVVGKVMVSLDDNSTLRFTLTQWHKTFGVLILLLSVCRLLWRVTHRAPSHPDNAPAWEHFAANASHILLYALLFIAPITGWMLVSVSPLNIDTYLFNVIPWPHLPWLTEIVDKTSAEARFAQFHEIATGALIALLLLHVAAALKHHLINKDTVLTRMMPTRDARTGQTMLGMAFSIALGCIVAVIGYATLKPSAPDMQAGNSAVRAIATVMGEATTISFSDSSVTASLNPDSAQSSQLSAIVNTSSATSDNMQVQGSLPDADWFNVAAHPQATFEATQIDSNAENVFNIAGILTIKGIDHPQEFELKIIDENGQKMATGEFIVDRAAYQLGLDSQPTGDYVDINVTIAFEFTITQ